MSIWEEIQREQRAAQARDIFTRTSNIVWDALPPESRMSPAPDRMQSYPDYDADYASHDDGYYAQNAMSVRGPDFEREVRRDASRRKAEVSRARFEACVEAGEDRARDACEADRMTLPDGRKVDNITAEQCLGFWADGYQGTTESVGTTAATTSTDSTERGSEMSAEAGLGPLGKVGGKATEKSGSSESRAAGVTTSLAKSRPFVPGYHQQCMAIEDDEYYKENRR